MSNDAFVAIPALVLALASALFILALTRGILLPAAAFNALAGLPLAVVMAQFISEEWHWGFDEMLLPEMATFALELTIALASVLFFSRRTHALAVTVKVGMGFHAVLAGAALTFAIVVANSNFAWH